MQPHDAQPQTPCSCGGRCDGPSRRDFLKTVAVGAAGAAGSLAPGLGVMAGPFERKDFDQLVPADKKLAPQWIESLFARGTPETYRGDELQYIGMPIGGICAGQVYLGGDGRLWHWDIFNHSEHTGAGFYAKPRTPQAPLEQGFTLTLAADKKPRPLDRTGFAEVTFTGQYPIGTVEYRDPGCPVQVTLEAFSPFIPLNLDDSSLPATILRFTLKNTAAEKVELTLAGHLENIICRSGLTVRRCTVKKTPAATLVELSARGDTPAAAQKPPRPDIVFEDFNKETYESWTVTGTAFGKGPAVVAEMPKYMGPIGAPGRRMVNSHASAPGKGVGEKDGATGTLTSKPFKIQRNYIRFFIGGGNHGRKTAINLLIDGKVDQSISGRNENRVHPEAFDVSALQGKTAQLQIVDNSTGPWGNIGIAQIVFSDRADKESGKLEDRPGFGTMTLALLEPRDGDATEPAEAQEAPGQEKLLGTASRRLALAPGESATVTFAITWHFPNFVLDRNRPALTGRYYATKFDSATAVAEYIATNYARLYRETKLWRDTWYDSTLPHWFLNRTFLNTSILATSTCYRFKDGRFYGWEGVGCCAGTCGHVWHYAHAPARLFPELERILRERVDFGLAMQPNGAIFFRGEFNNGPAGDAQAGSVLRALREHQMSPDDAFLKRNWEKIKRALQYLINEDGDGDGIIAGSQHNTLDANWFGPVAWLSGLYLAALRAGEEMAGEMGDREFAARCRAIFNVGTKKIVADLFDGEYFVNKPDPKFPKAINSGSGCEIDQVFGQSWAFQVGLGRVLPEKETQSALHALWRFNFAPDAGGYHEKMKAGRWYAMPGEAGLLMCTFPRVDWSFEQSCGVGNRAGFAMYFNECMNGFEHQAAGHMIWEGLVQEGLAVIRAVHDRYGAARRNPYNEIECGDHYARSMASYGVYLAACGYTYHGPQGRLGFAPRLTPDKFRAAFTTAEGWGTVSQDRTVAGLMQSIDLKYGKLRLRTLDLTPAAGSRPQTVEVKLAGAAVPATLKLADGQATITFAADVLLEAGQTLDVRLA